MIFSKKSYPKVNIFLKIIGYKNGYHIISSRFVKVKSIYDKISFIPVLKPIDSFTIEGFDEIDVKGNSITKAFYAINNSIESSDVLEFFYNHKVVVKKSIPTKAGLGGGSSNAGVFLRMVNEVCNLKLSSDELAKIGSKVGADVPFFVYDFNSANVSGFGEIVEEFSESELDLEIFTPPIACNTKSVYQEYRRIYLNNVIKEKERWDFFKMSSSEILENIKDAHILNDLYKPALNLCPELRKYVKDSYYFSGSGSSFFYTA